MGPFFLLLVQVFSVPKRPTQEYPPFYIVMIGNIERRKAHLKSITQKHPHNSKDSRNSFSLPFENPSRLSRLLQLLQLPISKCFASLRFCGLLSLSFPQPGVYNTRRDGTFSKELGRVNSVSWLSVVCWSCLRTFLTVIALFWVYSGCDRMQRFHKLSLYTI